MPTIPAPSAGDFAPYYSLYINPFMDTDIVESLKAQTEELRKLAAGLPDGSGTFRYAEGKWSINDLLQHIIDTERVFTYRTLCIARGDRTHLPDYDHVPYVSTAGADRRSLDSLLKEFEAVREAYLLLLDSLTPEDFEQKGTAAGNPVVAKAIPFIVCGHFSHHLGVIRERYLPAM